MSSIIKGRNRRIPHRNRTCQQSTGKKCPGAQRDLIMPGLSAQTEALLEGLAAGNLRNS